MQQQNNTNVGQSPGPSTRVYSNAGSSSQRAQNRSTSKRTHAELTSAPDHNSALQPRKRLQTDQSHAKGKAKAVYFNHGSVYALIRLNVEETKPEDHIIDFTTRYNGTVKVELCTQDMAVEFLSKQDDNMMQAKAWGPQVCHKFIVHHVAAVNLDPEDAAAMGVGPDTIALRELDSEDLAAMAAIGAMGPGILPFHNQGQHRDRHQLRHRHQHRHRLS
ncbi:hypothetical protein B0O80DRAFT_133314 [Mortierella sp. GBAus27b]|nr:hypothetical protein B0O80DRAFT_133314 [Mortierella sp. GBAus27b]